MTFKKISHKKSRKNIWICRVRAKPVLGVVVGLVFVCVVSTEPQSSPRDTCSTTEGNASLPKQVRK